MENRLTAQASAAADNPFAHLHSRYNPRAEAVRFIDSLQIKDTTECFILIEPGMGYLVPALRERFNKSKIITLHVDNFPQEQKTGCEQTEDAVLFSIDSSQVKKFLEKEVPETNIENIRIIEWRPSLNYFKEAYITLLSIVVDFLKQISAVKRTTAAFGKRWIKNFFNNLGKLNKILLYRQTEIPVIITGSGPGLEDALPVINKLQKNCLIIAASSSAMALSSGGIKADIVIATDGGNWALRHLLFTQRNKEHFHNTDGNYFSEGYAVNLCAALPSQTKDSPFFILNDGSFWQSVILHELAVPSVIIAQRGTVTATAVDLALLLSSGGIYLAGMDFSNSDIITHARPYAFDGFLFGKANRFLPVYSESFTRSRLIKEGGSMNIYASWFKDQLQLWPQRIFSLTDHKIFNKSIPEKNAELKNTNNIFNIKNIKEDTACFYKRGTNALFSAMRNSKYADSIKKELASLLFPSDESKAAAQEIETELRRELKIGNGEQKID